VAVTLALMALAAPDTADAQIRGQPTASAPSMGWWVSGGASAVRISDINDGVSRTKWDFGTDPIWQYRATIEKVLDEATTFGLVGGYAPVNVRLSSIGTGVSPALPAGCDTSCAGTAEMWTGMLQFRSGGGTGFHTLFEASGGATSFRKFTSASGAPLVGIKNSIDLSGTLGAGFAYPLSQSMVIAVVQDIGLGYHSKADLPDGVSRTWRVRNTRASLRIKFGGR